MIVENKSIVKLFIPMKFLPVQVIYNYGLNYRNGAKANWKREIL